jgi:hypothetical protein
LSLHRSPEPPRRSRRLLVCGMTAALLVVPGVAHAEGSTDPLGSARSQLEGIPQDLQNGLATGAGTGTGDAKLPLPLPIPGVGTGTDTGGAGGTDTSTEPSTGTTPSLDPSQLQALLTALPVSPECVSAISDDLQTVLTSVPATIEALAGQLQTGLTDALAAPPTNPTEFQGSLMGLIDQVADPGVDPEELPVVGAVEALVGDFLAFCLPELPTAAPTPAAPVPAAQTSAAPVAAPAATAPAAPVAYLGYAPTGAPADPSGASAPLLALGGVLLLAGGLAGTWMRLRRGISPRG